MKSLLVCAMLLLAANAKAAEPLALSIDTATTLFNEIREAVWGMPNKESSLWEEQDFSQHYIDYELWDNYRKNAKDITHDLKGYTINALDLFSSYLRKGDHAMPYNGVFGPRNKRLQVYVSDYSKKVNNSIKIYGVTKRGKQTHPFSGTIQVIKVLQAPKPIDQRENGDTTFHTLLAKYRLVEDVNEEGAGTFEGTYCARVKVMANFNFMANELKREVVTDREGPNYSNRNFVGTWTSHNTNEKLKAIWGDNELPFPLDFAIGVGVELNEKYIDEGWESYMDADSEIEKLYDEDGEHTGDKLKDEWWNR